MQKPFKRNDQYSAEHSGYVNPTKPLVSSILASVVACFGLLVFNFLALTVPVDIIQKSLRTDFADNPNVFDNGLSSFNDCLIMAMTIDRPDNALDAVISPNRIYGIKKGSQDICGGLRDLAYQGDINPATHISVPYHQYWGGMRSVLDLTLPVLGVKGVRRSLQIIWLLCFVFAFYTNIKRLASDQTTNGGDRIQATSILVILICIAVFFQVAEKSKSFDAAPTDIIFLVMLAVARPKQDQRPDDLKLYVGLGVVGAFVAYFEMLHGAIPLFVAAIFFLAAPSPEASESFLQMMWKAALPVSAFLAGVATAFLVKIFLILVFIDSTYLIKFMDLINYRITGDAREYDISAIAHRFQGHHVTVLTVLRSFKMYAGKITWGSRLFGVTVMVVTCIIHAVGIVVIFVSNYRTICRRLQMMIASSAVIFMWWTVFMAHTAEHPHMILRLWAWPIAMGVLMVQQMTKLIFSKKQQPNLFMPEKNADA